LTLNNIVTLKSGLEVTQGHSNWHHSKAWCNFLFAFHSNYGSILHYFRDKAWYWSKIVIYWYPLVFDAPVRGVPSEYCYAVWHGKKLEWRGYPTVKTFWMICLFVLTQLTNVTDRQTHRHRMTAKAALDTSIAQQKKTKLTTVIVCKQSCCPNELWLFF